MTNKEKYARMIDHTNLHADATDADMKKLCDEARENHFRMVAINPAQVKRCKGFLKDTDVHVGAAIAFPLGQETLATKVYSVKDAIENGADEIDMVINIGDAKAGNWEKIKEEIHRLKNICGEHILKVIIETCLLTEQEKIKMCEVVTQAGADFIKTSTGFSTSGATFEDIQLFKKYVGSGVKIKAAGGISSFEDAEEFVRLGADRLGTSRLVKILKSGQK